MHFEGVDCVHEGVDASRVARRGGSPARVCLGAGAFCSGSWVCRGVGPHAACFDAWRRGPAEGIGRARVGSRSAGSAPHPSAVESPGGEGAVLAAIRAACALTVEGHRAGLAAVAEGAGEWAVEARLEGAFRHGGAFGPAFATIVGSGANACVLHYTRNDAVMHEGDLVLIDAGAELAHYSGDITRTVPVSGTFSSEQRAVYEVVEAARAAGVLATEPGASVDAPHDAAVRVMVEGLIALGVLQGSVENALELHSYAPYLPHKTSHWLGLDVHDVGDYVVDGAPRVLESGMVLTVEPGMYFQPGDESVPEPYRGMGVRIEDDVLVTSTGRENLTEVLPTDPDALTELMSELRASTGNPSG